MKPGSLCTLG